MVHLFAVTWQTCRDLIADLTLQMEINNAMQRIVDDLRVASHAENLSNGRFQINSYLYQTSDNSILESTPGNNASTRPIYYFKSETTEGDYTYNAIYRQRRAAEKDHPITGKDILSDVNVLSFGRVEKEPHLWEIVIEAQSRVSWHKYRLETKVYIGGADR